MQLSDQEVATVKASGAAPELKSFSMISLRIPEKTKVPGYPQKPHGQIYGDKLTYNVTIGGVLIFIYSARMTCSGGVV